MIESPVPRTAAVRLGSNRSFSHPLNRDGGISQDQTTTASPICRARSTIGDFPPETEASFRRALYSEEPAGQIPGAAGDPAPRTLVAGIARGPLWGGNLATLVSLCGSSSRLSGAGRILFLEDVEEPAYRVDRMLTQLARAGVLHGVRGLAFGRFSGVSPGEGEAVVSTLKQFAEEHGLPSATDLPFGHTKHNCTLPIGAFAQLDAEAGTLTILEGAVERSRGTVLPVS
jgi:muramoyltetrapeptide carboxypeptidase